MREEKIFLGPTAIIYNYPFFPLWLPGLSLAQSTEFSHPDDAPPTRSVAPISLLHPFPLEGDSKKISRHRPKWKQLRVAGLLPPAGGMMSSWQNLLITSTLSLTYTPLDTSAAKPDRRREPQEELVRDRKKVKKYHTAMDGRLYADHGQTRRIVFQTSKSVLVLCNRSLETLYEFHPSLRIEIHLGVYAVNMLRFSDRSTRGTYFV